MSRVEEPVHSEAAKGPGGDDDRVDTHPAFGVAVVTRGSGGGRPLFQSDLLHRETITLRVHRAERTRGLHHDWTFQRETLVEVEFSLAQWGALVSSIGIGSGVPCTIRSTEGNPLVPDLPYQPRLAESIAEMKGSAARLVERANETLAALQAAVKTGRIGAIKAALADHERAIQHVESNAEFTVKSMHDAAEQTVAQARSDIEAHVLGAQRLVGTTSIESPHIDLDQIEGSAS